MPNDKTTLQKLASAVQNITSEIATLKQSLSRGAKLHYPLDQTSQNILETWFTSRRTGIASAGGFSTSPRLFHTGGVPAQVSTDGTDQTPVATEVYICELFVPCNVTVTGLAVMNGSAVSGNLKAGLANSAGYVIATSDSTAQSGTDAYQRIPFTNQIALVGPATYYSLVFIDNTTGRLNTHTFGNFGASKQTGQTYSTGFTKITPPSTFTTALGTIASLY